MAKRKPSASLPKPKAQARQTGAGSSRTGVNDAAASVSPAWATMLSTHAPIEAVQEERARPDPFAGPQFRELREHGLLGVYKSLHEKPVKLEDKTPF